MANFCLGEGKKLGRTLPQHKLMQNLLGDCVQSKTKSSKSTQTESRRIESATNCCLCSSERSAKKALKRSESKVKVKDRKSEQSYHDLMTSIRERVVLTRQDDCCSCSESWSDNSTGGGDDVVFPKETRNAMSMLMDGERRRPLPPPLKQSNAVKPSAWPGVAERMDHDGERRLINVDEMVAKITSELSKNKLDMN